MQFSGVFLFFDLLFYIFLVRLLEAYDFTIFIYSYSVEPYEFRS